MVSNNEDEGDDGDGVDDLSDAFPLNWEQTDTDGDGVGADKLNGDNDDLDHG